MPQIERWEISHGHRQTIHRVVIQLEIWIRDRLEIIYDQLLSEN